MKTIIEPHYKAKAKKIVDTLFDKNLLNDELTRDDMNSLEDILSLEFQYSADSYRDAYDLLQKIKK